MFDELLKFIRGQYKTNDAIPLHAPVLNNFDREGVLEAIDSGFVSSVGPHVPKFEEELAKATGAVKAVAVVNGTAALHMAMIVSGVQPGDAVITQALTFVATANAISYLGAKPIFLDSDPETLGLSHKALANFLSISAIKKDGKAFLKSSGQKIAACVPMHVFGHPVKIMEIMDVCNEWGIPLIEDAAEALGSEVDGKKLGSIAPIGALSFNGNKIITTGGGGALLFRDEALAAKAKHLSTTAKRPHTWEFYHDEVGYNYRMPNLNAALGCAQLKRLPEFLAVKAKLAHSYEQFFATQKDVKFISARTGTKPNWWLNAVLVRDRVVRDQWLKEANAQGIMLRPVWELMSDLPMYANCSRDSLEASRALANRLINLPSGVTQ